MKNKPTRHKETNTFKFQPFSERLANVDINVYHRVGHKNEDDSDDEESTYLYKCLTKWNVLNLTDSYDNFRKELPNIQCLPLILNQKEAIVSVILKHLEIKNPLSIQPILEFVVALAQDLRQEICPFYPDIVQKLIGLLSTKDTDILEWTFTCLAYLFKFLWRYFVKDVEFVFETFIPLLTGNRPPYINNFAAESFAFIVRKVKDKEGFLKLILETLKEKPNSSFGCGCLLFEVMRGAAGHFHSCAADLLSLYFKSLSNPDLPQQTLFEVLSHMVNAMCGGIKPQKNAVFWSTIQEVLQQFLSAWKKNPSDQSVNSLLLLFKLVQQVVQYKNCAFVSNSKSFVRLLVVMLGETGLPDSFLSVAFDIGANLLLSPQLQLAQEHASLITIKLLDLPKPHLLLDFMRKLLPYSGFDSLVLPHLLLYCHYLQEGVSDRNVLHILAQLVLYKSPPCAFGIDLAAWKPYPLDVDGCMSRTRRQARKVSTFNFSDYVTKLLAHSSNDINQNLDDYLCALICLPHIRPLCTDTDLLQAVLRNLLNTMRSYVAGMGNCGHTGAVGVETPDNTGSDVTGNDALPTTNGEKADSVKEESVSLKDTVPSRFVDRKLADEEHDNNTVKAKKSSTTKDKPDQENLLFILSFAIEMVVHLTDSESLKKVCGLEDLLEIILPLAATGNISALRSVDLYLTAHTVDSLNAEDKETTFKKIYYHLHGLLTSPFHKVRLLTVHIFSLFEDKLEAGFTPFKVCLDAELVEPAVHTYRDKLTRLQQLEFDVAKFSQVNPEELKQVPLHYLLSMLYVNFQLIWEPTIKLIASHARGMPILDFWKIFSEQLSAASLQVNSDQHCSTTISRVSNLKNRFLQDLYSSTHQLSDKPDFANYRILLWKALSEFPEICEVKNKDVTPIFLTFVQEEYFKYNTGEAKTWNIRSGTKKTEGEVSMDVDVSETGEQEIENVPTDLGELSAAGDCKISGKNCSRTLIAQLSVFAKLRNPKALHREPELNKLYYHFLSHKNPEIQKLALNCLLTYKHKFLSPYQANLFNLMNEKTFKTEITSFRIDKESTLIQEEHRQNLLPIIMRIVYSKMLTKTGTRTSSKSSGQLGRSLVLRFLAGCHEDELMIFLEMAFRFYSKLIKDDPVDMVRSIMKGIDLEKVMNLKRLQSSLNLIGVVMNKFGALMGNRLLPYVLRVLMCVASCVTGVLAHRDSLYVGYIPTLRSLRAMCVSTCTNFFKSFEDYPWTSGELDAVYEVFVWPWLSKLHVEGVHSPTALLKLFVCWSQNPRYFVLLAKYAEAMPDLSPLPCIMKLLTGDKTHPSVTSLIMELVENLMTLQDHQVEVTDEQLPESDLKCVKMSLPLEITCVSSLDDAAIAQLTLSEDLNYGTKLLLPHISSVLSYLQRRMTTSRGGLKQRDFTVLSRISELVHDPSLSATLLELFLPAVIKISVTTSEETSGKMIETVANLVKNVSEPKRYIRPLAPLFGIISATPSRKLLCNLIKTTVEIQPENNSGSLIKNAEVLCEINAWDTKWVDQPDFNQRLDGFKRIHDMLAAGEVEIDIGISLIHNCFYLLKSEKDLALRDSTGYCLRKLAPALCKKYGEFTKERELVVNDTVLNLIRLGIRDKNEVVWHESVALLGEMSRECKELHPVLRDLSALANKQDPEVDFFENILHLQLHRKERALLKFCELAKQLPKAPNPQTLTQFILPLASMFLFSEKFVTKHSLISASIETVGVICRLLPWHQYETLLRFYLGKLRDREFQKQAIRIVVAILDAFHFNLAKASAVKEVVEKPVEQANDCVVDVGNAESGSAPLMEIEKESITAENTDKDPENLLNSSIPQEEESTVSFQRQANLPPSTANRVIHTISVALLPQLYHVIGQRTTSEMQHKVNRKQTGLDGEDDVLRIPVALAIVKLLQRLPERVMEQHLPGVLLKLCMFLKSRLDSVRRTTRETMQQVMLTLGTAYLGTLLREMTSLLTKGFQVHVLVYSIHSVLLTMKQHFKPGDVDSCLQLVLEICKLDLFGAQAEEKDVNKITARFFEAKSTKSFDTFHILAQNVTEKCLTDLILPLKEALMKYHSHKIVTKVSECLRQVVLGLSENAFISPQNLVIFLYGVTSQSIPELIPESKKAPLSEEEKEKQVRLKPSDTFLIPEAPKNRAGAVTVKAKVSTQTGAHILVEFGTRLLHALLKKEKLKSEEYKPFLDPMVPILEGCLKSQHVQLSIQTLQCLCWVLKMNLPSMKEHVRGVAAQIFNILHKYAVSGQYKGDNSELVAVAFKAVTVLVRDVHYHLVDQSQLKALLVYAEKYIHDYNRQAAAFGLLKAVLTRKMVLPEVVGVMKKVALLSVTSEHEHIRLQARQVFHQFLMNYPLGKKLEQHLSFYLAQLDYSVQSGRESALEMLKTVITSFPQATLEELSGVLFIPLAARLVNEHSRECKKMAADCIRTMLQRLGRDDRNRLFDVVTIWLQERKVKHRQLAVQLCSLFAEEEKESFAQRLATLLPCLVKQFGNGFDDDQPGKFVRIVPAVQDEKEVDDAERREQMKDHLLFQTFQTLMKICESCPQFLRSTEWRDHVESFAENAELLLAHPHEWVRLGASRFLGFVFGSLDPKAVAAMATHKDNGNLRDGGYLRHRKGQGKLRSLVLDFCALLHPGNVAPDLVKQVLKNLVFLAKVLKHLPDSGMEENGNGDSANESEEEGDCDEDKGETKVKISLLWMIKRMRRVINIEIAETPKETAMQSAVFKWIGAVAVDMEKDKLSPSILHHLLAPIVRETTIADENRAELLSVAKDVANIIKKKMGMEEYTRLVSKIQARLTVKRAERKKQRTQEVVSEPQKAAKRKLKHHQKKKDSKKRKIDFLKGRRKFDRNPKTRDINR